MTEIPEHLLKRSRERRSALGLGGDDAPAGGEDAAPAATTPAKTASTAPEAAASSGPARRAAASVDTAPPEPEPVHPTVLAATRRRKIPIWALVALSLLPIWLFMYARALTPGEVAAEGPVSLGSEVYGNCASCHGGTGGGGVGYAFSDGEILKTYPNIEDMLRYVYFGTGEYNLAGVTIPGDPERDGGPHITGALGAMPQFGTTAGGALPDYRLLAVSCHIRYTLGGADPADPEWAEEYESWCSVDSEKFQALQADQVSLTNLETMFPDIIPIGNVPVSGSPAGVR